MSEQIKNLLQHYFPAEVFPDNLISEAIQNGEILSIPDEILVYLQTALLDKKVLEVELDGSPKIYFTRIGDYPAQAEEVSPNNTGDDLPKTEEKGESSGGAEPQRGDYLLEKSHIITLPLEPGLGNLHLRHSLIITLRMFTKAYAVEFGTTFAELTKLEELPVLKLKYPEVARIVRNAREYRAKVPESLDFIAAIDTDSDEPIIASPVNISLKGMGFAFTKQDYRAVQRDDLLTFKLYLDDELRVRLQGKVRHLSKIRKSKTIEYICGVEFELGSRITASAIESLVAAVQRAHLQELASLSEKSGIELIT